MTRLTLFNPSFQRLLSDPSLDLPVRFVETAFRGANRASPWMPPVDVHESDTEVVLEAELPGLSRDDISVRYHDGRLILEGQREETDETKSEDSLTACAPESWIRRERVAGRFQRSFDLPKSVDSSAIRAESKDGLLRIVLPKLEKAQPRQIEVSVN